LHGTLLEEVYIEQPQGFVDAAQPDSVCKLHKSIYGLKQTPSAWFNCLSTAPLDLGFIDSMVDPSLFLFFHGQITIFMLVYVDDIIATSNKLSVILSLIVKLQQQFPLKDLGDLGFFLGVKVTRSTDAFHLSQSTLQTSSIALICLELNQLPLLALLAPRCHTLMATYLMIPLNIVKW
jgi:hypothetical protein